MKYLVCFLVIGLLVVVLLSVSENSKTQAKTGAQMHETWKTHNYYVSPKFEECRKNHGIC